MTLPEPFTRSLLKLGGNPERSRAILMNPALTLVEKKILEAYLGIRANKNVEAVRDLRAAGRARHPFVEAERRLMIGVALLNLSRFRESRIALKSAIGLLERLEAPEFRFTAWFNFFLNCFNAGDRAGMDRSLRVMAGISRVSEWSKVRLLRVRFLHAVETGDRIAALDLLPSIRAEISKLPESDRISQEVSEFRFRILWGEFEEARKLLLGMKRFRKFHLKQNFKFMKILLDHLTGGRPVYAYAKDFKDAPLLFAQLRVIQALESGDRKKALQEWKALSELSPEIHREAFETVGPETLFSLCLKRNGFRESQTEENKSKESGSLPVKLILILRKFRRPIQKAELFERIWGRPLSDKEDLKRLSRLVSKARKAHAVSIRSRAGAYSLQ